MDTVRDRALEAFGAVHVVCNNAGVAGGGIVDAPLELWEWVIGVNLLGVVHGVHTFLPLLMEQDEGHIVNTASLAGLGGVAGLGIYCTTKFAVVGLSESLYFDLAARGSAVGVSVLCPGFVQTRIGESARNAPASITDWASSADAAATRDIANALAAAGIMPEVVADAVFDAMVDGTFFILPHAHAAQATTRARLEWMQGGLPPQLDPTRAVRAVRTRSGSRRSTGRSAGGPGACGFELRGDAEQHVLPSGRGHQLDADRQSVGPVQRHRHRRLPGDVERHRERGVGRGRDERASASSPRISPSGAGGRAIVGVRRRSKPPSSESHQRATRRDQARSDSTASR